MGNENNSILIECNIIQLQKNMKFPDKQMELKIIILSEIKNSQKDKQHMFY